MQLRKKNKPEDSNLFVEEDVIAELGVTIPIDESPDVKMFENPLDLLETFN